MALPFAEPSLLDLIDPDKVDAELGPRTGAIVRRFFRETDSTNDLARAHLMSPEAPTRAALVAAESQRAGRGRHGRSWVSAPSRNLLFSLALPSAMVEGLAPGIAALAAAEAVCEAVESFEPKARPSIKWPNDVQIEGKKIAGVLAESVAGRGLVIGVGVNVNGLREELPEDLRESASSLRMATGRAWPREALLGRIARLMLDWIESAEPGRSEKARAAWRARCSVEGKRLRVRRGDATLEGFALGLDDDGALLLLCDDGIRRRLLSAEVTFQGAKDRAE